MQQSFRATSITTLVCVTWDLSISVYTQGLPASFTDFSNLETSFLEKISRTDPFYDRRRILDLKGPLLYESFSWILEHDDFSKWNNSKESGVFWIKGDPGKGKTMLLCGIINGLENISGIHFSYFFCQATDSRINTAKAVVGGLLRFFLERHKKLLGHVSETFKDKLDQLSGPNAWEVLCDIFEMVAQEPSLPDPICIIDALDECEHDCKSLLNLIVKTSPHVKWLISSRNTKDIERRLQSIDPSRRLSLELGGNALYVSHSVDAYINRSIHNIEALEHNEDLRAYTTNILRSKANGTYLWVSLVVGQLQNTDQRNIKHILNKMPEGLENLYSLIMTQSYERLGQEDREAYPIILSTVATAKRPLLLEELFTFVKCQWKYSDNIHSIRDMQDMVKDCGAFLSIRDNTIYFIHQSAKDFMTHNALELIFPSGIRFQHSRMFQTSLNTLSTFLRYNIYNLKAPDIGVKDLSLPCPDPLAPIAYCCVFWVEHLVHSCESNKSEIEKSESEELFKNNGIIHSFLKDKYLCWLEALALLRKLTPQGVDAAHKLKRLVGDMADSEQRNDTSCLRAFIDDAYRFLSQYKDTVSNWPLQLYYSAMVFDDKNSVIYKTFQQTIRTKFSDAPILINRPQRWLSLQQVVESDGNDHNNWSLYFSPDSTLLGSLSWKELSPRLSLWKTDSGALKRVIEINSDNQYETECPHGDIDCYVAFTPDSQHLVSVSSTGVVQTWAINSGCRIMCCFLPLKTHIYSFVREEDGYRKTDFLQERVVALSQNGDLVASAHRTSSSGVSSVKIWSTKTGDCLLEIEQSNRAEDFGPYHMLSVFSPNSTLLALIDESSIRIYCTQTGKQVYRLTEKFEMHWDYDETLLMAKAKFSPDSQILVRMNHKVIDVFRIETWTKLLQHLYDEEIEDWYCDFDISPDSTIILLLSQLRLTMLSTVEEKHLLQTSTAENFVAFSPCWSASSFVLASSSSSETRLWRVDASNTLNDINNRVSKSSSMTISPNSRLLAVTDSEEHNVKIWNANRGKCMLVFDCPASDSKPVFSHNSELLACGDSDTGDIRVWRINTGKCIHISRGGGASWSRVVFSPDSEIIAYIRGDLEAPGDVCVWHINTGKFSRLLNRLKGTTAVFSDDSRHLFLKDQYELCVWVYCMESDQCVYQYACQDYWKQLDKMIISPCSKYIALESGGRREVQVWDWRTDHCASSFSYGSSIVCERARSLSFSSDSTVLAVVCSVSDGYEAHIWEVATSLCLARVAVEGHEWWRCYHEPSFDLTEGCINTFCGSFVRKESSWEHCDKTLQPRYYTGYADEAGWAYFDREKVSVIPEELRLFGVEASAQKSSSLLVYSNSLLQITIIKFPSREKGQEKETGVEEEEQVED